MKNGTFVSQDKYIKYMIKKFDMNESKAINTPMETNGNLDSDASGNMVDQKLYRSMIGSYRWNLVGSLPRGYAYGSRWIGEGAREETGWWHKTQETTIRQVRAINLT